MELQRSRYVQIDDGLQADLTHAVEEPKPRSERSIREILGLQTKAEVEAACSGTNRGGSHEVKRMEHQRKLQEMIHI